MLALEAPITPPSLLLMGLQTALFVAAWLMVHNHVKLRGPIPYASTITRINNAIYSPICLILLVLILSPFHDALARQLYHLSKFYEYFDILTVRASGGVIDLHFGFHHLTTPYLTFFRVLRHSQEWKWFAALNTFHHVLMYAYFGGLAFVRPVLPWTGALQLIIGMGADGWAAREKLRLGDGPLWPNVVSACILGTYLFLSTRELRKRQTTTQETKQE